MITKTYYIFANPLLLFGQAYEEKGIRPAGAAWAVLSATFKTGDILIYSYVCYV